RVLRALAAGLVHMRSRGFRGIVSANDVLYQRGGRVGWMGLPRRVRNARLALDCDTGPSPPMPGPVELVWVAPEDVTGLLGGEATDVYALGAVLHGLLALAPPLRLPTELEPNSLFRQIRDAERTRPSAHRASVDPLLDRVCARAIERDPAARYASVADFLAALDGAPEPSAPSSVLEKVLEPGEVVRFERHPLGWPPLTGRTVVFYGAFLLLAALPTLAGFQLSLQVQKLTLPVPVMLPALALVAIVELIRFASFRSRLYVATNRRVLVLGGLFSSKLRGDLPRERMRGLQLVGTEPAIALEERKVLLSGLDEADLESVRAALGEPLLPVLPPVKVKKTRRWRRPLALRLTLLLAVFVEVEGWVQRESEARFRATSAKVRGAVVAAEAAISSLVALETGAAVGRKTTQGDYSNPFMEQARFRSRVLIGKHELVSVETRCERVRNLIPLGPTVTVLPDPEGSWNARFLEELRLELEREEIEAVWPK
ncbi:MAG: hypothetical protein ACAI25_18935, partial [Planctomycetota bacterium]